MGNETNGTEPRPLQRVLIESDGHAVKLTMGCPYDVAEGILYRALSHVQREILLGRLRQEAEPKIEIAGALPKHPGML